MSSPLEKEAIYNLIREAGADRSISDLRYRLAAISSMMFSEAGEEMCVVGELSGPPPASRESPFGNGNDELAAISLLLRITGELTECIANLFKSGHSYAAAALLRQIVEVEYLAWAFATKDNEALRWLRSTKKERVNFFTPKKLCKAAEGKFRGQDYGYHCELGGHPVPTAEVLFSNKSDCSQLLLSDLLGHVGRIWEHFVFWADKQALGQPILRRTPLMREKFMKWKQFDPLLNLPPPP